MAVLSSPLVLIQSIPPVTRAFTAATFLSSALYAYLCWKGLSSEAAYYMTVVPGSALYAPWTLLTSALVETSIFEFVLTIVFVPASLKYLERLWGSLETVKFIVVSVVASNIIAFGFNWIEFIATRNADLFLYGMQYHGQMSLQIALLVAFTQLIPEHQVQFFGVIKARVKTLPMTYLTLSTVLCFVGFQCPWIIIQFGWFVGWVYLRFYKKNTGDSVGGVDTYGDRSETFSLISWFPPFMHYPLTLLGNFVYSLATRFHLIPSAGADVELGGYAQVPVNARAEAERRRAMALKALDQRLANTSSPVGSHSTNPAPSQSRQPPTIARSESGGSSTSQPAKSLTESDDSTKT
ncbi:eukaryotic integral membrane protein-domain-containing protein [Gymnopilus junonius]|uniref:Eukaryotic integral membrane protein-domain-containing protein n=1 Tax=Gymnopilus junonius TaxID=109634 RepID=A0A9P5NYS8_GYMJU|nr:eukaryotic integral membrane protein-domain-containing protein [Gymnopilus junonius]